jgi:hypothetical protein
MKPLFLQLMLFLEIKVLLLSACWIFPLAEQKPLLPNIMPSFLGVNVQSLKAE